MDSLNHIYRYAGLTATILFWVDSKSRRLSIFSTDAQYRQHFSQSLSQLMDRKLTSSDMLSIHAIFADGKWNPIEGPQWVPSTIDTLKLVLYRMTATNARKFIMNTTGQRALNLNLQRAFDTDPHLWKAWYAQDFPDLYDGTLPDFISKTAGEYSENQWKRHYMWTHYFILKGVRMILEQERQQPQEQGRMADCFGRAVITIENINICKLTHWMLNGDIFTTIRFPMVRIGEFIGIPTPNRARLILQKTLVTQNDTLMHRWLVKMLDKKLIYRVELDRFPRRNDGTLAISQSATQLADWEAMD